MNSIFKALALGGGYNLPFLIHLYDEEKNIELYFINDTQDLTYNGQTYKAGSFSYSVNKRVHGFDGGGNLEIACQDEITKLARTYNSIYLEVIGIMRNSSEVKTIDNWSHHYGSLSIANRKITFKFDSDDRITQMSFPANIWNKYNNRGN